MEAACAPLPARPAFTLRGLLEVASALLCAATVTGFLGRLWWVFELTSHFRLHLAMLLGVSAIAWTAKRCWRWAALCGAFVTINGLLALSILWPLAESPAGSGARLRLAVLNVHSANERHDLVLSFLRNAGADVILLMEVNDRWMRALAPLRGSHPHVIVQSREDNFGIALFSRVPLTGGAVLELGDAEVPSLTAEIAASGQRLVLLGTHPLPPASSTYARFRNSQLRSISEWTRRQRAPFVVFGDLNATPWSPHFTALLHESGLQNSAQGRGLFGSWPAWLPCGRIPLDHCLISPTIHVAGRRLGPAVGSDHLPIVVDLELPRANAHGGQP